MNWIRNLLPSTWINHLPSLAWVKSFSYYSPIDLSSVTPQDVESGLSKWESDGNAATEVRNEEVVEGRDELSLTQKEIDDLIAETRRDQARLDMQEAEEKLRGREEEMKAEMDRYKQEADASKRTLQADLEAAQRLLVAKIEELEEARVFTTTADKVAVGDIGSLVEALNEEIYQTSGIIANSLEFPSSSQDQLPEEEVLKAREELIDVLGSDIAEALWRSRHQEYDPIVTQYALQVAMAGFCEKMIHEWAPTSEANAHLESTYATIQTRESQAVAGRWRALTRATLDGARSTEALVQDLAEQLVNILAIAGSSRAQCEVTRIREQFLDYLVNIAKFITETRMATGEYITSVDVMVHAFPPGTPFGMDYMEDMFGETITEGKAIAGTTKLGIFLKELENTDEQLLMVYKPVVKAEVLLVDVLFC